MFCHGHWHSLQGGERAVVNEEYHDIRFWRNPLRAASIANAF
jgi:hypothetical protein